MNLIMVKWHDSNETWGWHENDSNYCPAFCVTVGHLVKEDELSVSVALTTNGAEHRCSTITIPRGCIKKMVRLVEDK